MSYSFAIISNDLEYVRRLILFIKDNKLSNTWRFYLFTSVQSFKEQAKEMQIDAIVIDGMGKDDMLPLQKLNYTMISLTEQFMNEKSSKQVYKYQPIPSLLHQLQQQVVSQSKPYYSSNHTVGTQIVGVSSSIAGSGKTMFAIHLCAALGARSNRVFYLNLEMWNSTESLLQLALPPSAVQSYSDLLYLLKTQPDQVSQWMSNHTLYDDRLKFERLLPFQHREDRIQLSKEDALDLVNALKNSNRFDYIVMDLNEGFTDWNFSLLAASDTVFQIQLNNFYWMEKHQQAVQYSQSTFTDLYEQVMDKTFVVTRETKTSLIADTHKPSEIRLPYLEQWEYERGQFLQSAPYRAAVEHCVQLLRKKDVVQR